MSTLKVNTIQNTSGGSSSTPEEIAQGRAKVWVNFNGTGTVAIRDSFNVSSITDVGTGQYGVNIQNAMANANYAVTTTGAHDLGISLNSGNLRVRSDVTITTTFFQVEWLNASSFFDDCQECNAIVFGDQ